MRISKAFVEPFRELRNGERFHARGGELDRKRDAVEAAADIGDDGRVVIGDRKARVGAIGSIGKECNRTVLQRFVSLQTGGFGRHRKRRKPMHDLARDIQCLA